MRDAARQLADRLHLGRLRDFPLQARLLRIVLEAEEHGGIAQPARAGDGERHGLVRMVLQPHRHVGGVGGAAREATDRVGDRGLVLAHHQVARIDGRVAAADAGGAREGVVHLQEAAVAVDQRHPERHQRNEAADVRRGRRADRGRILTVVEQRDENGRVVALDERQLQDA